MTNNISTEKLNDLIAKNFGRQPKDLLLVGRGEISTTYSFGVGSKKYIIRLAGKDTGFKNDRFIAKFSSDKLYIPATLYMGRIEDNFYSITQKCPGHLIDDFDYNNRVNLLSDFIKVTHHFHSLSINSTSGFGPLDDNGNGVFNSWLDFLSNLSQGSSSFWPRDYFFRQNQKIIISLKFIPSIRQLVHGDYGFNNVFASHGSISGIIDWSDAKYGDFVYDIAYLSFWSKSIDYSKVFFNFYRSQDQLDLSNFFHRFYCYTIHAALSLLNYYSVTKQLVSFDFIKGKLDDFIEQYSI